MLTEILVVIYPLVQLIYTPKNYIFQIDFHRARNPFFGKFCHGWNRRHLKHKSQPQASSNFDFRSGRTTLVHRSRNAIKTQKNKFKNSPQPKELCLESMHIIFHAYCRLYLLEFGQISDGPYFGQFSVGQLTNSLDIGRTSV